MPSLPTIQPEDVKLAERARHTGTFDALGLDEHRDAIVDYAMRLGDDA